MEWSDVFSNENYYTNMTYSAMHEFLEKEYTTENTIPR